MITVKFDVTQTQVSVAEKSDKLTSGNEQQIKCVFNLSEEYEELLVRAVFNGEYRTLVNGECFAPELAEGKCIIGVYGYSINGDKTVQRISPIPCEEYVYKGSYCDKCTEADDASPSELEAHYDSVKKLIDSGVMKGDKGDKGEKGDKGDPAQLPDGLLRTITVHNDEEFEGVIEMLTQDFDNAPLELIVGYDAVESQGFAEGTAIMIIEGSEPGFDYAYFFPYACSDVPFTSNLESSINYSQDFVANYAENTAWLDIHDYSISHVHNSFLYSDGSDLVARNTRYFMADISLSGSDWIEFECGRGTAVRFTKEEFGVEDGPFDVSVNIEPGVGFFLVTLSNNAKRITKRTGNTFQALTLSVSTNGNGTINVTNAYGRM